MIIRSEKEFEPYGVTFKAIVEMSGPYSGDDGFPTSIFIESNGNRFDVEKGPCGEYVKLSIRGTWENVLCGDVFEWIGKEIKRLRKEIEVK